MQKTKKIVFIAAAAVSSTAIFIPAFGAGSSWKSYTKLNSGLAGNNVASIALDPDGENVWFGSGEDILFTGLPGSRGVSRYNISTDKWTVFNTTDGLAHNSIFSIEIDDRFGWFGTRKGISRYEKGTGAWTTFDSTNSILEESIIRQIKLDMNDLWILTYRGKVYRYQPSSGNWSSFSVVVEVNQIATDAESVWFATNDGVRKYDKLSSQWTTFNSSAGLLDDFIICISTDDQSVWLGTKNGVTCLDRNSGSVNNFTSMNSGLPDNRVIATAAEQHFVWFVTENKGVSRMNKDTGQWSIFSSENSGLSENAVQSLAVDAGSIWFGTQNKGISRFEKNSAAWNVLNKSTGLASNDVFSITVDSTSVWLCTKGGVNRFEKSTGELTLYTTLNSGLSDNTALCSAADKNIIWFGTEVGGLCRYDIINDNWESFDINNSGIADNYVQCLAVDDNDIWLGTQGQGLSRYSKRDKKWKRYYSEAIAFDDKIPSNDIRSIAIDSQYVWVGYVHSFILGGLGDEETALSRYNKNTREWFHFTGDFFSGYMLAGNNIQALGIDGTFIWIGFFEPWSGAMNRYNTATDGLETITYEDGLADRNVWSIGIGPRFNWFGTGSGVNRYDKMKKNMLTFSVSDDLANNWIRSIGIDHNRVWLGTLGGGANIFEDQSAPRIIHEPISNKRPADQALTISVRIEENISLTDAWLFYRPKNHTRMDSVKLENKMADFWSADIPSSEVSTEGVEYYLKAEDGYNVSYHPWRYPGTAAHPIETYDDTPPSCTLTIRPSQNKGFIFPNDIVLLEGQVDGTHSVPTVSGIAMNEYSSAGSLIRRTVLPAGTVSLDGTGTVKTIKDSVQIGGLDPSAASVGLELTIHESDSVQNQAFQSNRVLVLQDTDFPFCSITDPKTGSEIGLNVPIWGTVYDANFYQYRLEYGTSESPSEWHPILVPNADAALIDTVLGDWYTLDLPDTVYTIRLTAVDLASQASSDWVVVRVRKIPVYAAVGGTIVSPDGKASLRLSPNAIDHDQPIFINVADPLPPVTDSDLSSMGIGYNFLPLDLKLQKPATVELAYPIGDSRLTTDEKLLSIFRWDAKGNQWNGMGGTVDPKQKTIKLAVRELGMYTVMIDRSAHAESSLLSNIAIQPRIFSPRGGGFDTRTAISFELGKETTVTIKIYNGAGRLVRTLKENEIMSYRSNVVDWDGKDQDGEFCVSGLYIVTIQADNKTETKTVVVLNKF